jgi:hypothetical protein
VNRDGTGGPKDSHAHVMRHRMAAFEEPCHRQRKGTTTDRRDGDLGIVQGFPHQGWEVGLHRPGQQNWDSGDLAPILRFADRPRCPRHDDEIGVVWVESGCCTQDEAT